MNNIEKLANKLNNDIYNDGKDEQQVFVDPASITLIVTLIVELIKLFNNCKKDEEEALQVAHTPTTRERRLLKREIRKKLGWGNWVLRQQYYEQILNHGTTVNYDQMKGLYADKSAYTTLAYDAGSTTTGQMEE